MFPLEAVDLQKHLKDAIKHLDGEGLENLNLFEGTHFQLPLREVLMCALRDVETRMASTAKHEESLTP